MSGAGHGGSRIALSQRGRCARSCARDAPGSGPTAYQVYATLVVGGIAGALAGNAVSEAIGGSLNAHKVLVFGPVRAVPRAPGAAPVRYLAGPGRLLDRRRQLPAHRADRDRGFGAAEARSGPVGRRRRRRSGRRVSPSCHDRRGRGSPRALGTVAGVAAFAVLGVAASWLVESSRTSLGPRASREPRRARDRRRAARGRRHPGSRSVAVWSGPWGWAIAPLAGSSGWPRALGLMLLTTAAVRVSRGAGPAPPVPRCSWPVPRPGPG